MTEKEKDNLFYFCSLFEFLCRKTRNLPSVLIKYFTERQINHLLEYADVNHCLSFEQVSDEVIEQTGIKDGNFDSVSRCEYAVPSFTAIGRVFQMLIDNAQKNKTISAITIEVYSSFLADAIVDYNTSLYYSSPEYLKCCWDEKAIVA